MKHKGIRITLAVIEALIGLGAIGGGIALLTGAFDQLFPVTWLQGTPFSDYTIPGLILLIVVGGGMLLTAAAQFIQRQWAVLLSAAMGLVMLGWIAFEVAIIDRYAQAVVPSTVVQQILFLVLGLVMIGLAASLWKKDREDARTSTMSEQMPLKRPMSEPVTDPAGATGRRHPAAWRRPALVGVKALHSLIYFSIESCMGYLLYTGLQGQEDRRTALAAGVVAAESLIFVGNGRRCPLTGLAETLGAENGSVTDIYLPSWLASNLFPIHLPLLALALWLHARNFLRRRTLAGG